MILTADGSIDQERILVSEWITPSLCLPPECRRTGSTGWLSVCGTGPFQWSLLKLLIGQSRSLSFLCSILVLIWLWNDKRVRESKVMQSQSVPLWQLEERCSWAETKVCMQDLYRLLHLLGVPLGKEKELTKQEHLSLRMPGITNQELTLSHWEQANTHVLRCYPQRALL